LEILDSVRADDLIFPFYDFGFLPAVTDFAAALDVAYYARFAVASRAARQPGCRSAKAGRA